jgi:Rieske 2Fe-2S family protein
LTATGLPAGLIPTLPGRYYTDPGIFAAEQAAIFESLWFCAMRSAELPGPGSLAC